MEKINTSGKQPVEIELEAGKSYSWCQCGMSTTQPFCNSSGHVGTKVEPKVFKVISTRKAWLCMCKKTKTVPYCDGSHNK